MAKNSLVVKGKKGDYKSIVDILANPSQRSKLQNYIDEAVRCKMQILEKQEDIKTLREGATEEINIEPKAFNQLVSLFYNNNFDQKKEELEKLVDTIDALMGTTPSLSNNTSADNE